MEDISTKALILGTGIFVTIIIVTLVLASFNQMQDIMGLTKQADPSLHGMFDNTTANLISKYDGKSFNGMELVNLIKRFEDDPVTGFYVVYPNSTDIKEEADKQKVRESVYLKYIIENNIVVSGKTYSYDKKYNVTVEEKQQDIYIIFD